VQSYEHDFPFQDASDTAVISMRDDITSSRDVCEISVPNLLAYSALFDIEYVPESDTELFHTSSSPPYSIPESEPIPVWKAEDCTVLSGGAITNCIKVTRLTGLASDDVPLPEAAQEVGDVPGYRITFHPGDGDSFNADVALAQTLTLDRGYYRLSWYGRQAPSSSYDPMDAVIFRTDEGDPIEDYQSAVEGPVEGVGWDRFYRIIRVPINGAGVQIAIVPERIGDPPVTTMTEHSVDIAGLMLEDITASVFGQPDPAVPMEFDPADYSPAYYVATRAPGVGISPVCEDSTGRVFRNTRWVSGCVNLCPGGFGTCAEGEKHCYRELLFSIDIDGIEKGGLLQQSGFAYGNYNYRTEALAVNLVGTQLRDCSASPTPDTCYSSGSIPFSVTHLGPYAVRNHRGDIYEAPLYTGRIEHGRALAAERYISNPISSADRALLQDYWHRELRGRPITGNYSLRIWESEEVVFENLEDVQLVLDYRYWTRFE
jgi:hypothetical protein